MFLVVAYLRPLPRHPSGYSTLPCRSQLDFICPAVSGPTFLRPNFPRLPRALPAPCRLLLAAARTMPPPSASRRPRHLLFGPAPPVPSIFFLSVGFFLCAALSSALGCAHAVRARLTAAHRVRTASPKAPFLPNCSPAETAEKKTPRATTAPPLLLHHYSPT